MNERPDPPPLWMEVGRLAVIAVFGAALGVGLTLAVAAVFT